MLKKYLGITRIDELVSMVLGLFIVLVASWVLFNYFRKELAGNIPIPELSMKLPTFDNLKQKLDVDQNSAVAETKVLGLTETKLPQKMYMVQKGDNLWKIAKRELGDGNKYPELAKMNNILGSAGSLRVGQVILIPDKLIETNSIVKTQVSIPGGEYTVAKGDSLANIALRAYGDMYAWNRIWVANKNTVQNPNLIFSGSKLVIPR